MSLQDLYNLLSTLSLPVAYDHFLSKTTPPFIIYVQSGINRLSADDKNCFVDNTYNVFLVTDIKDVEKEALIETLFDNNFIPYEKSETYIDEEQIYQVTYNI